MTLRKLKRYRFAATRIVSISVEVDCADRIDARELARAQANGPGRFADWRDALDTVETSIDLEDVDDIEPSGD